MATQTQQVNLLAVGDIGPARENPAELFELCAPVLRTGDITFGQLEVTFSTRGTHQSLNLNNACNRSDPESISALTDAGFTLISVASNHAMDWGEDALVDTVDHLRARGVIAIGGGRTLDEARQPELIQKNGIRIATIARCSMVSPGMAAERAKPGVAPLTVYTAYRQIDWQPGSRPKILTWCDAEELEELVSAVRALRENNDVVVVSLHAGMVHVPEELAQYQFEASHAVVDAGADLVLQHHAHILKGIEVYKGTTIFHGLGNFAYDSHSMRGERRKSSKEFHDFYKRKVEPGWELYPYQPDARKTMIAHVVLEKSGVTRVSYFPAMINQLGQAEPLPRSDPRSEEVFAYVERISKGQGLAVEFSWDGDEVLISPPQAA